MKKIILIIFSLFLTFAAKAQFTIDYAHFEIGGYSFYAGHKSLSEAILGPEIKHRAGPEYRVQGGGSYELTGYPEELEIVYKFILDNKERLEEKYGVTISDIIYVSSRGLISMKVFNTKVHDAWEEAQKQKQLLEEMRREEERANRINSLQNIF